MSEHIPEVERQIRLIKERVQAICSTLPFKKIPGRMIILLVNYAVVLLNTHTPPSSGVSDADSTRTIIMGTALDYANHRKSPFRAYIEAHEDQVRTHTLEERIRVSICLGPTANFQGSYNFMRMRTGGRYTHKKIKELTNAVISDQTG
jgi:hypothetical protein